MLILGGTAEAVALADALVARWGDAIDIVTSLAGRTATPAEVQGMVRTGGFGGTQALTHYLRDQHVCAVIDATHPFAAGISGNARAACLGAGVPRIALVRPNWSREPDDHWHMQPSIETAASALHGFGRRAFLTVGRTELGAFSACADTWFLVRMIEVPADRLPLADYTAIAGRGPFSVTDERALMDDHEIDVLVCKASGGEATEAKLVAARQRGIPVVMVERPPPPEGTQTDSVAGVVDWVAALIA